MYVVVLDYCGGHPLQPVLSIYYIKYNKFLPEIFIKSSFLSLSKTVFDYSEPDGEESGLELPFST